MESLENVYGINKSISELRGKILHVVYNDFQRSLDLDSIKLKEINNIRMEYGVLAHERNGHIKQAYSRTIVRSKTIPQNTVQILPPLAIPKLKVTTMVIGKNSTKLYMTPDWFKPDDEKEILKTIKYPPNITDHRPYDTVARFRSVKNGKNTSNDFTSKPIKVKETETETLVLALDAFVQQFGGKLSFTTEDLSFEDSSHRTACGVANLGSTHLLASEHIPSAKFALLIDLNYNDLAQSTEKMQNFILTFVNAVAQDLSCDNHHVRVTSVEKSTKGKGKAEVNLALTTPDKAKTKELADTFQDHARLGFSGNAVLGHIIPDEYECKWMPILSYLQLQPMDFDPRYNRLYTEKDLNHDEKRGGLPYYLPIGWFHHALKVDNKYKDESAWFGSCNGPGEWPVAFHGTRSEAVKGIADQGLLVSAAKTDLMMNDAIAQKGELANRPGLYVATHCNCGSHPTYTTKFDVKTSPKKTETYQIVFQCRVRPDSYSIHKGPVKVGEAWRIVDPTAVRPYGILLKNINTKVQNE